MNYSLVFNCQIYPHIGSVSEFSDENRIALDKITDVTMSTDEFYKSVTPFIELLETHGYVGTTVKLARHALTALYLFLDMHLFGFHQDIMWIWFAEISRTMGRSWLHWRRVLKFYEDYTLSGDIHPAGKYRYNSVMFDELPSWCKEAISGLLDQKRCEFRDAGTIKSTVVPARVFADFWLNGEALATCSARTSVIRQFALFLVPLGIEAYIPSDFCKAEKKVVHILSNAEIKAFSEEADSYVPAINIAGFYRLATEYKVIIRLIYCCGLRISEARKLRWKNVDFKQGTIRTLQSKGHKDRLVYMAEDLTELLQTYEKVLYDKYHCLSDLVFPARETDRCLSNVTIDKKFREFWALTPYAEYCDKAPTVHCLRHTFVVKRMNLWMEEGIPLKEMLPFLSRYLGHQSPDETFYYYHQVAEAFRIVRGKDKTGKLVIPEVNAYE